MAHGAPHPPSLAKWLITILEFFQDRFYRVILLGYLKFKCVTGIHFDTRTHRSGNGDTLDVITLCASWTSLVHRIHQGRKIFIELFSAKGNLANRYMNIGCFIQTEFNTASLCLPDGTRQPRSHSAQCLVPRLIIDAIEIPGSLLASLPPVVLLAPKAA